MNFFFSRSCLGFMVGCLLALCLGCSVPDRIVVINNSGLVLKLKGANDQLWTAPAEGEVEIVFDHRVNQVSLASDGGVRTVYWRLPPPEMFWRRGLSRRAGLSVERDGRIYAVDLSQNRSNRKPMESQPEGFPLTPQ